MWLCCTSLKTTSFWQTLKLLFIKIRTDLNFTTAVKLVSDMNPYLTWGKRHILSSPQDAMTVNLL